MAYILYKLTFASGKVYIGQTTRTMHYRMQAHKTQVRLGSQLPVHCAWRKYGAPVIDVIGEFETHGELHAAEVAAIKDYGAQVPNGYNVTIGGDTAPSKCPEVAAKISAKAMGNKRRTPDECSVTSREQWQDPEYRGKVYKGVTEAWAQNPELRQNASLKFKAMWAKRKTEGWSMPEETRKKLSEKTFSAETRAKMSAAAKARKRAPVSDQTRAKLSASAKRQWQDPELTERRVSAILKAKGLL